MQFETNIDITGALELKIKYTKPGSTTVGEFSASSADDALGYIYHDFIEGELTESGVWTFWAYVTFSDGRTAPGEAVKVRVFDEGE